MDLPLFGYGQPDRIWSLPLERLHQHDDPQYIIGNSHLQRGLSRETLRWAFTTFEAGNWHPLTWISHALDIQMFGLAV